MIFFHLRPLSIPTVAPEDRYTVSRMPIPNCYRLIVRHGYTDVVITSELGNLVYQEVRKFVVCEATRTGKKKAEGNAISEQTLASRLTALENAYAKQVLYIVGKGQMRISPSTALWRRIVLNAYLWLKDNTRTKLADYNISTDQLVEVGFIKDI